MQHALLSPSHTATSAADLHRELRRGRNLRPAPVSRARYVFASSMSPACCVGASARWCGWNATCESFFESAFYQNTTFLPFSSFFIFRGRSKVSERAFIHYLPGSKISVSHRKSKPSKLGYVVSGQSRATKYHYKVGPTDLFTFSSTQQAGRWKLPEINVTDS